MSAEEGTPEQRKRTRGECELARSSNVWEHFILFTDDLGNKKARCKRCSQVLNASQGTSSPKKHVNICSAQEGEPAAVGVAAAAAALPPLLAPPTAPCASLDEANKHLAQSSDPASLASSSSAPPQPHDQLLLLSRPDGSSGREPAGQEEDEASRDLAQMIALHGYDPSFLEDDYFRSFVRRLNPEFEVPSRVAIEEMCDGIFDETRENLFSRISNVPPGRVSLSVGTVRTMEREVLYTACHFIDDEWNLHRVIMDAYVDGYDHHDNYAPLLGVHQVPLSQADSRKDCIEKVMDGFSQRHVLHNMFMMLWETTGDDAIHLRNQIEENKFISTTFMDKAICSVTIWLWLAANTTFDDGITSDLEDLHLTRQKRHKILSELGLDYNLWASGEYWYWNYCSLEVLGKVGSTLRDTGSEFAELLCKIYGETYRAIQRISASNRPTSNICLVELFKLRQVLQSQVARASGDTAAAYESCNRFLDRELGKDVTEVLRDAMDHLDKRIKDSYLIWSIPLILDPRYKLEYIEFIFQKEFVDSEATSCISKVTRQIKKLYTDYLKHGAGTNNAMAACSSTDPLQEAWEERCHLRDGMSTEDAETELDCYLKDRLAPHTESFDILKWWKDNSRNYPTIARMAMDALAMPTCSKLSSKQMAHVRSIIRGYSKAAFQLSRPTS